MTLFLFTGRNADAQDIHFSQFYASPLTLNPALTGIIDGSFRVAGIYRNQWNSVTTPFVTVGGSYDMKLLQGKLKNDIFGAGLSVTHDKSGDGGLSNLGILASGSFHKGLGGKGKHLLGIGLQLGYVQRSLDAATLLLPSQHNGEEFDPNQASGENFTGANIGYFDMNVGLLWSFNISKRVSMFHGGSVFHLTQPKESFLDDNSDNRLPMRYVVQGGGRIKIIDNLYFTPNYIFMYQDKAQQINFGSAFEYHFTKQKVVASIGGWYRVKDAPIVSTGLEYRSVRLGFSYDLNTSELQPASNTRGAFEISLIYLGNFNTADDGPILVPCPRL